jgi:hypothetical protein
MTMGNHGKESMSGDHGMYISSRRAKMMGCWGPARTANWAASRRSLYVSHEKYLDLNRDGLGLDISGYIRSEAEACRVPLDRSPCGMYRRTRTPGAGKYVPPYRVQGVEGKFFHAALCSAHTPAKVTGRHIIDHSGCQSRKIPARAAMAHKVFSSLRPYRRGSRTSGRTGSSARLLAFCLPDLPAVPPR